MATHKDHQEVSELTEVEVGKKDEKIQVDSDEKVTLKAQIQQMHLEIKEANERTESHSKELQLTRRSVREEESMIASLKKDLLSRQFFIMYLKADKKKFKEVLEEEKKEKCLVEMALCKSRMIIHRLSQKIKHQEVKMKEISKYNEMYLTNEKRWQNEIDALLKEKASDAEAIENFKKQVTDIEAELNLTIMRLHERDILLQREQKSSVIVRRDLETKQKEFKDLQSTLLQLTTDNQNFEISVRSLTNTVQNLQQQIHGHKEKNLDWEGEIKRLKEDLVRERNQSCFYQRAEYAARTHTNSLQLKVAELSRLQKAVDAATQQSGAKVNKLGSEVDYLNKLVEQLQLKNANNTCSLREKDRLLGVLKDEKEREVVKLQKIVETRTRELETCKERVMHLAADRQSAQLKIGALTADVDEKVRRIGSLEQLLSKLQWELKKKEVETETLSQEMRALKHALAAKKRTPKTFLLYDKEINNLKRLLEEERQKNKALGKEITKPKGGKQWHDFVHSELYSETLLLKNSRLQMQLSRKNDTLRKMEGDLRSKAAEADALRAEMKQRSEMVLDEKLWTIQKDLEASRSRIKSLLGERSVTESLCSKYEKEIAQLRKELKECTKSKVNN